MGFWLGTLLFLAIEIACYGVIVVTTKDREQKPCEPCPSTTLLSRARATCFKLSAHSRKSVHSMEAHIQTRLCPLFTGSGSCWRRRPSCAAGSCETLPRPDIQALRTAWHA